MRYVMMLLAVAIVATSCSKSTPSHPGVQINDSLMYISANPITGKPVTFWHALSEPRSELLREALTWRYGPAGITITPEGKEPIVLSNVEVSNSRVTRKITVKQGDVVLYADEQDVTQDNLAVLSSCTVESADWQDIPLGDDEIIFSVDYWRYYETKYGGGGESMLSDMVMIPVRTK